MHDRSHTAKPHLHVLACLRGRSPKNIAHSCLACANVLVQELRALNINVAHASGGQCSCHRMRLATARRPVQQHARAQP